MLSKHLAKLLAELRPSLTSIQTPRKSSSPASPNLCCFLILNFFFLLIFLAVTAQCSFSETTSKSDSAVLVHSKLNASLIEYSKQATYSAFTIRFPGKRNTPFPAYDISRLDNPARIVFDIKDDCNVNNANVPVPASSQVTRIRIGKQTGVTRIVFDLSSAQNISYNTEKVIPPLNNASPFLLITFAEDVDLGPAAILARGIFDPESSKSLNNTEQLKAALSSSFTQKSEFTTTNADSNKSSSGHVIPDKENTLSVEESASEPAIVQSMQFRSLDQGANILVIRTSAALRQTPTSTEKGNDRYIVDLGKTQGIESLPKGLLAPFIQGQIRTVRPFMEKGSLKLDIYLAGTYSVNKENKGLEISLLQKGVEIEAKN